MRNWKGSFIDTFHFWGYALENWLSAVASAH